MLKALEKPKEMMTLTKLKHGKLLYHITHNRPQKWNSL